MQNAMSLRRGLRCLFVSYAGRLARALHILRICGGRSMCTAGGLPCLQELHALLEGTAALCFVGIPVM